MILPDNRSANWCLRPFELLECTTLLRLSGILSCELVLTIMNES